MILLMMLACGTGDKVRPTHILPDQDTALPEHIDTGDTGPSDAPDTEETALDGTLLLRRMSLDLRGVLPTTAELDAVESDPNALDAWLEEALSDPRLEERLVHLLAERWHTRVDDFLVDVTEYATFAEDPDSEYAVERSIGEEPLRLIARIVMEDRPWRDVVTTDETMANPTLAEVWPLAHPGGEGWSKSSYTDGRPAAGVLSTNGLWWRYYSTRSNLNRARVAALTRLLICEDYAARTITFADDETLASAGDLETALKSSPYCMGCHSAIDPIAATLMGFWPANPYQVDEISTYHSEREALAESMLDVSPAWFGDPVYGLNELGEHIAEDPRYLPCATETFATLLWRRDTTLDDFAQLHQLTQGFEKEGSLVRPLLRAITQTQSYREGPGSNNGRRMLSPTQLSSAIEDLTGFRWTFAGYAQLDNDTIGYRNLAGGVDGNAVTRPQEAPSLTWALTLQRLSEGAAGHAVHGDLIASDGTGLLSRVDLDTRSTDSAFNKQLKELHWRMYGARAQEEWLTAITQLWERVEAEEGAQSAWTALVSAMLRDPSFGSY